MTNINNPAGARIRGAIQNADFNPNSFKYIIPATDSVDLFRNDFVKTNGTSINGIPVVVKAAADDVLRGIVVGFEKNHDYENITYREANTERIVYVNHAPSVEFEIQASGTLTENDIGKNFNILVNGGNTGTGLSATQLDTSTGTTSVAQLKLISIIENPINELGAYTKVRAMILKHEIAPIPIHVTDQLQIYYVGKAGSDSYNGKSIEHPFLTIEAAITAVLAQTPSSTNRFEIRIIGGGIFTENVTIPTYTKIIGKSTKIIGTITYGDQSLLEIHELNIPNSSNGVVLSGVIGYLYTDNLNGGTSSIGASLSAGATLFYNVKNSSLTGTGSKTFALVGNSTIYVNCIKLREHTAHSIEAGSNAYFNVLDYKTNSDTFIYNRYGHIIIEALGTTVDNRVKLKDSTGEILTHEGKYIKFTNSPRFGAWLNNTQNGVTGDGTVYTIIFNNEIQDNGDHYDNTTGVFTSPITGDYIFTYSLALTGFAAHTTLEAWLVAGADTFYAINCDPTNIKTSGTTIYINGSHKISSLGSTSTAYVQVRVSGSTKTINMVSGNANKFAGTFIGSTII